MQFTVSLLYKVFLFTVSTEVQNIHCTNKARRELEIIHVNTKYVTMQKILDLSSFIHNTFPRL